MTIISFPFNSNKGDRKYEAKDFAINQASLYENGILGNTSSNLQVFANQDMSVKVNRGSAIVNGVTMLSDSDYNIKIDIADSVLARIDKIVLRLDNEKRALGLEVKKGSYSSNPVAPSLTRNADIWELGIADIRVDKGAIKISQADIRDLRHTKECGISSFRGSPIDVDNIYIQYEDELKGLVSATETELKDLLEKLKNILTGDEYGKLIALIDSKQDKVVKDSVTTAEYIFTVKETRPYLEVVKI